MASGGTILDTNSNELLEFAQTADAQNHIKITNKGTGNGPVIQAVGSVDTNVGLNLLGKGTGSLTFNNIFTVSSVGNVDVPGTLNVTGVTTLTGALAANGGISVATNKFTVASATGGTAISNDIDDEFVALTLVNQSDSADTTGIVSLRFDLEDTSGTAVDAGKIAIKKNETFTSTGTTQNSNMVFSTSFEGALTEYMTLTSAGALNLAGALNVTGATAITGTLDVTGATIITGALTTSSTTKFGGYTYTWPEQDTGTAGEFLKISTVDNNSHTITLDWDTAGGGGVTTLDDLTDVVTSNGVIDFYNSIFISTNNDGDSLSTVTGSSNNIIIGAGGGNSSTSYALTSGTNNIVLGNNAFTSATTASDNIVLGVTAGSSITTGTNNTLVGKSAGTQVFIVTQETGTLDANGNSTTVFTLESTQSGVDDYYNGLTITFTSGSNDGETRTISDYVGGSSQTVTVSSSFAFIPTSGDTYQINYGNLDANGNSTTVFTLESDKSSTDDFYNGCSITFTSGTNNGETQTISDYVGSSRTVTVSSAFSANPTLVDTYYIKSAALSTGEYNTLIGSNTYCTAAGDNQTSLGYQAGCTAANQVTLGNSSITALRCADTTIASLSDARDKTNVSDSTYGIDFINSLRPVQYTWDRRNLQPGDSTSVLNGKTRVGFLAQELQGAMPNGENDVLDLVYEVDQNRLEAKYGNLIPILTKAIQDLSAANEALMARVTALENA